MKNCSNCSAANFLVAIAVLAGCLGIGSSVAFYFFQEGALSWPCYYILSVVVFGSLISFACCSLRLRQKGHAGAAMKSIGIVLIGSAVGFTISYPLSLKPHNDHPLMQSDSEFATPAVILTLCMGVTLVTIGCCLDYDADVKTPTCRFGAFLIFCVLVIAGIVPWALGLVLLNPSMAYTRTIGSVIISLPSPYLSYQDMIIAFLHFASTVIHLLRLFPKFPRRVIIGLLIPISIINVSLALCNLLDSPVTPFIGLLPDTTNGYSLCIITVTNLVVLTLVSFTKMRTTKSHAATEEQKTDNPTTNFSTNIAIESPTDMDKDLIRYI